jgi:hypothetical protein
MGEAERKPSRPAMWDTPDGGDRGPQYCCPPSDDLIDLEALIAQADPTWWAYDGMPWDLCYPVIPF